MCSTHTLWGLACAKTFSFLKVVVRTEHIENKVNGANGERQEISNDQSTNMRGHNTEDEMGKTQRADGDDNEWNAY